MRRNLGLCSAADGEKDHETGPAAPLHFIWPDAAQVPSRSEWHLIGLGLRFSRRQCTTCSGSLRSSRQQCTPCSDSLRFSRRQCTTCSGSLRFPRRQCTRCSDSLRFSRRQRTRCSDSLRFSKRQNTTCSDAMQLSRCWCTQCSDGLWSARRQCARCFDGRSRSSGLRNRQFDPTSARSRARSVRSASGRDWRLLRDNRKTRLERRGGDQIRDRHRVGDLGFPEASRVVEAADLGIAEERHHRHGAGLGLFGHRL